MNYALETTPALRRLPLLIQEGSSVKLPSSDELIFTHIFGWTRGVVTRTMPVCSPEGA
jgi:hypothetical protein